LSKIKIGAILASIATVISILLLLINIMDSIYTIMNSNRTIIIDGIEYFVAQKTGSYLGLVVVSILIFIITIVLWCLYFKQNNYD
jgi:hypothetical protein